MEPLIETHADRALIVGIYKQAVVDEHVDWLKSENGMAAARQVGPLGITDFSVCPFQKNQSAEQIEYLGSLTCQQKPRKGGLFCEKHRTPKQRIAVIAAAKRAAKQASRIAAVFLLGLSASACFFVAATGPTPTIAPVGTPTPTPSPSPSPSPGVSPTADPCAFKAVRVSFAGGSSAQIPSLPLGGEPVRLDATPINDSGPVPDGCNVLRDPIWSVLTPVTCQIVGGGYNPWLRGLRVGACTVSVTVERVVSAPFTVEIR